MKRIFTLILIVTMLIVGSTTTAFANRGRNHGGNQPPPQQRYQQQRYYQAPQRHQQHWRHHGPSTGFLIGAVIADVIALGNDNNPCGNNPCEQEQEVYQPPCNGPTIIAQGSIPYGSGQYVQISAGQYADIVFRNGISERYYGPRRVFDVSRYTLYQE